MFVKVILMGFEPDALYELVEKGRWESRIRRPNGKEVTLSNSYLRF